MQTETNKKQQPKIAEEGFVAGLLQLGGPNTPGAVPVPRETPQWFYFETPGRRRRRAPPP